MDDQMERYVQLERDAARWKREEKALREMERRFYAVFDNPLFLALVVVRGRIRQMNRRSEDVLDFSLRDRPGADLANLLAPGSARVAETLLDSRSGTETASLRIRSEKGAERWLDVVSLPVEYSGESARLLLAFDATERESVRSELRTAGATREAALRSLFAEDSGLNGALLDREGRILAAGGGFRRACDEYFGLDAGVGTPLFDVLPDSTVVTLKNLWQSALSGADVCGSTDSGMNLDVCFVPLTGENGDVSAVMLSLSRGNAAALAPERESGDDASAEDTLRDAAERVPVILGTLRVSEGVSVAGNGAFRETFGITSSGMIPMDPARFFRTGDEWNAFLTELRKERDACVFPVCFLTGGKSRKFLFRGRRGTEEGNMAFVLDDVREDGTSVPQEARPQREDPNDPATGLPGPVAFEPVIAREVTRSERYRGSLSLLLLRIDGYESLPDRMSEGTRNGVLREFTALLKARIRPNDFLGRWKDGAFAILTPLGATSAIQLAEKIRDLVNHYKFSGDIRLTASLGVAEHCAGEGASDLAERAAGALGEAFSSGGDQVRAAS